MKRQRSPQEKKILSYQKDRRNSYGESDKGSRSSIRRNKAFVNRNYRRAVKQVLDPYDPQESEVAADEVARSDWTKVSDTSLADWIESSRLYVEGPQRDSALRQEAKRRLASKEDRSHMK